MESNNTWIGVTLAIIGSLVTALGNHLIVKSHSKRLDPSVAQYYFWTGNACAALIGTVFGVLALAYAPQSLISPLGGLTMVWNLVLATLPVFGGIQPKPLQVLATIATLFGTMIIVWLGPENRGRKNSFWMFTEPSFLSLVVVYGGLGAMLEAIKNQNKLYHRIAAGATGGLVGGLSNLFAKAAVDFNSGNQIPEEANDYGSFILVVVIAIGLALSQLMFLNNALASFPAVQIVPIYQTTLIVAATISGGIAFNEFDEFPLFQYFGFSCGVMVSILGVAFLTSLSSSPPSNEEMKD